VWGLEVRRVWQPGGACVYGADEGEGEDVGVDDEEGEGEGGTAVDVVEIVIAK